MKKVIIIAGLIFGLISCTQTKYFVKTDTALSKMDLDNTIINYIPITEAELASSNILASTYSLLEAKKYARLSEYLEKIETNSPDYYLAKALYHISKSEYQEATHFLRKITANSYDLLKQLLLVDVSYELARLDGSVNYKSFLQDYQSIIDNHSDNEQLKKIVAVRIRYIRYNY
jgi:hypothetical protein